MRNTIKNIAVFTLLLILSGCSNCTKPWAPLTRLWPDNDMEDWCAYSENCDESVAKAIEEK